MDRQVEDLTRLLPDDVLADVLGRIAPRCLAKSRSVCRAWCTLVDTRRLLRADLLPHSLAGLFFNYNELRLSEFFSRPHVDFTDYRSMPHTRVRDHCNGLLLLYNGVLNPATGEWTKLPEHPPPHLGRKRFFQDMYLAFDPAVSSHFEVFLIPRVPQELYDELDEFEAHESVALGSEWPPSPYILNVFSSTTRQWMDKTFMREGEAAGTIASILRDQRWFHHRHAVYWRDGLYVHCENDFVIRISLSNNTYRVIKPPFGAETCKYPELHLGRSEKGAYCALLDDENHLRVWILEQSRGRMEWVLKHNSGRGIARSSLNCVQKVHGPWTLQNANNSDGDIMEAPVEHEAEWNSDDENIPHVEYTFKNKHCNYVDIIGFHPFKEIVFLHRSLERGLAYHLNTSKLQDLGNICPKDYLRGAIHCLLKSCFPYTPCRM